MRIKPMFLTIKILRKVFFLLVFVFSIQILNAQPIVCGPVNTLYQTVGNGVDGTTEVYRYNNFQQEYIKVGELPGVSNNSASNSAYNATTQLIYSSTGGNQVRVYDPANNYAYVGTITITGNTETFNHVMFAQGDYLGYVNGNKVIQIDVTGISSYPATRAVNERAIAGSSGPNDYSLLGDNIYGVTGSTLRIINLVTNTVTDRNITFDNSIDGDSNNGGSFGAAWQDRHGNFYFFSNNGGGIYKIADVENTGSTVAKKILLAYPSNQNDGFGCEIGKDPLDWDEDGVSDPDDIDDDNDGILDIFESGGTGLNPAGDHDGDGVYNFRDPDIAGYVDDNGDSINDNFDFDRDGVPDAYDLDSDNDGIPDNIEGQPTATYIAPSGSDSNRDGLDDIYATTPPSLPNTDGIGNADYLDVDSDDDGLYDTEEANIVLAGNDSDLDGLDDATDATIDVTDPNGTINTPAALPDEDGDLASGGDVDYRDSKDSDNDNVLDVVDLDDDNDGILDTDEYFGLEPFGDEDGDGIYNYADAVDNNGAGDGSTTNYTDSNNDNIPDAFDIDLDGTPNHLDLDSDGDLCLDATEAENSDPNGDGIAGGLPTVVDTDGKVTGTAPINGAYDGTHPAVTAFGALGVIDTEPTANYTVCLGDNAVIGVLASGGGLLYQWQEKIGTGAFANVSNGVNGGVTYAGVNTDELTITSPPVTYAGRQYRVLISSSTNACTDLTSGISTLAFDSSVGGTISANQEICEGTVPADITVAGFNGNIVNWEISTSATFASDVSDISSTLATLPGITIGSLTTTSYVRALVKDGVCGEVGSAIHTITVNPTPATPIVASPLTNTCPSTTVDLTGSVLGSGGTILYRTTNDPNGTAVSEPTAVGSGTYHIFEQHPISACISASATIVVNIQNCAPSQGNETLPAIEDIATSTPNLLENNSDVDGIVTVSTLNGTSVRGGSFSYNVADSTFSYTPASNFNGNDTIFYEVCDNDGLCVDDSVFITVAGVNDTPSQGNEPMTVTEDDPSTTSPNLVANNIDPDGTTTTVTAVVSTTGGGSTSITNGGTTIDYQPVPNFNGVDTVIYTVCDAGIPMPAECVNDTLFVTVTPVNDTPSQGNEPMTVTEDDPSTTSPNLVANNIDPDGTPTTVTAVVSTTGGGSTSITNGGTTIDYQPAPNFNGVDTVIYTVCDAGIPMPAECVNDTLFVTVTPVNDTPSQGNEPMTVTEDDPSTTSPNLVANNIDPDGTTTTVTAVVSTTGGGSTSITNGGTTIDYQPAPNFNGVDTVIYTVCDAGIPMPAECVNDTLFVTITPVNDTPSQGNEPMTVTEDDPSTTSPNLVANNIDPDGTTTTVTAVVRTTGGGSTSITNGGTTIDYQPVPNFNGVDTVIYTVCDAGIPMPAECVNDTLFVTVTPVNDTPSQGNEPMTVTEDDPSTTSPNLVANNIDPDGTTTTVTAVVSTTGGGSTSITNGGTSIDYQPAPNFNGVDTIIYTVCDAGIPMPAECVNDTLFVTVTPVNDTPSQGNEPMMVTEDDPSTTSPNLVANNIDPDGTTTTVTAVVSTTGGGSTTITNGGTSIDYQPAPNFNGVDTVIYTVCDAGIPMPAECVNDTLFVTVSSVNDTPSQGNEPMTVTEDDPSTTSPNLVANNIDPDGTPTTVTAVVSTTGGGSTSITNGGTTIDYQPAPNFNGVDTVIYTVCDAGIPLPAECVNDTLFVTVTPVNDTPSQGNEPMMVTEDDPSTTSPNLVANNIDPDGTTTTVTAVVSTTGGGSTSITNGGTSIDYQPAPNFNGVDTVIYTVCDAGIPMPAECVNDTLFVRVEAAPDAVADEDSTNEDTVLEGSVLDNDDLGSEPTRVVGYDAKTENGGTVVMLQNGTYTYTPPADFNGEDTFAYTIRDENGKMSSATVTINVLPVNDSPIAVDDTYEVMEEGTVVLNPLNLDSDPEGDELSVASINGVALTPGTAQEIPTDNGNIHIDSDGNIVYSPNINYSGLESIPYVLSDGTDTDSANQVIEVIAIVRTIDVDMASYCENNAAYVGYSINANFTPVVNPVTIQWFDNEENLVHEVKELPLSGDVLWPGVEVNEEGVAIDWPGWIQENGIWKEGSDGFENMRPIVKIIVMVNPSDTLFVEYPPATPECASAPELLAIDDELKTNYEEALTIPVKANDSGLPSGVVVTADGTSTNGGTVVVNADGTVTYTPAAGFSGEDTFEYTITTEDGRTSTATVSIEVEAEIVPVVPIDAIEDEFSSINGSEISGSITENDLNLNENTLVNTTSLNGPENGTLTINEDGSFSYVPNDGFYGDDHFVYEICDTLNKICDTATVSITSLKDTDADGVVDNEDADSDNDGIADEVEGDVDTDGDGIPDYLDIDSDNDGITDIEEVQEEGNYVAPTGIDTDKDGLDDAYDTDNGGTTLNPVDTDGDGTPDYLDTDSDNDGVEDLIEGSDANNDGVADVIPTGSDSDNDGLDDVFDIIDGIDAAQNAIGSNAPLQDIDNDNERNWRDTDDDNDGILTAIENNNGLGTDKDEDKDGIPDYLDLSNDCELFIPNGFSPNDDNINDFFVIEFCGNTNAKIEIYNRWGNQVYDKENYGDESRWGTNDAWWDGRSNNDLTIGDDKLPAATYFYILYFNDGTREPITGSIFLNR